MTTVYLSEQGSILKKVGDRLVVEKNREVLAEISRREVETLFLYGNVQVTGHALSELLDRGIEVALLTLHGRLKGQVTPIKARNVPLRMRQYEVGGDLPRALPLARALVRGKIENCAALLRRFRRGDPASIAPAEIAALDAVAQRVEWAASGAELLGVESMAAARYFPWLGTQVPAEFPFSGRNRRPPRDPLNALLSFGYVLVGNELQALLDGMGFDPYLGFFHPIAHGRPSLALDLLEEFRPALVDRLSVNLLSLRILQLADFTSSPEKGVQLDRAAMKRYFAAYEKELETPIPLGEDSLSWRQLFRRQAERLARALLTEEPYEAFRLPP